MIVLIDNYDSFTFNLVHYLGELGAEVDVHRNDKVTSGAVIAADPDAIVLSPGPCTPKEAGICLDLIAQAAATIPILGVCLGHQAIGEAFGGKVVRAPTPVHGKLSEIRHQRHAGFFAASTRRSRRRAIIRWSSSATACRDELDRDRRNRRRPRHGACAYAAAGARRAIPSRKHRLGARPPDAEELSRYRRGLERFDRTAQPRAAAAQNAASARQLRAAP